MDALPTTKQEKIKLVEINDYLSCPLCKGYYIDATTISECLHSFCRSCIIQFLQENSHCPICEVIINKAKPNIKLDKTLQDIVYKLVPELFLSEMARRQTFYRQRPELAAKVTPEERGEDTERTIFNPKDLISLSIEYISDDSTPGAISVPVPLDSTKNSKNCDSNDSQMKRFLQCPGMCRIEVLKKFVQNKYNVNSTLFHIEVLYKRVPLPNHYTLIDIAYIYSWKRNEPMKFFFRIMEKSTVETTENSAAPEIFVKPVKPTRNVERTNKANRCQNKKKICSPEKKILTPEKKISSPEKKIEVDILNTDKIKDEIKNKLQDIGKGPVYTNITLNRSNNVEIITKVQKVSNKNGQPIGLNIIKQTVKKAPPRLSEKVNGLKIEISPEIPQNIIACKTDIKKPKSPEKRSKEVIAKSPGRPNKKIINITKDKCISKEGNDSSKRDKDVINQIEAIKDALPAIDVAKEEEKCGEDQKLMELDDKSIISKDFHDAAPTRIKEPSNGIENEVHITFTTKMEEKDEKNDNKENEKQKSDERKSEIVCVEGNAPPKSTANEIAKQDQGIQDDTNVIFQTIVKKKDFDIDEEKSNFLKSIELTARSALQTLQGIKTPEKTNTVTTNLNISNLTNPKSAQKRKNCSPCKNERKKSKKAKNSQPKPLGSPSMDKIVKLAEKQTNGGDLQSLFSSCKINIPSSLSITLKESSEDDRDRRNAASLRPVQNYIEILKLPDFNQQEATAATKNDLDNRFKSKTSPSLLCKVNPVSVKDAIKQSQTFQKMFEDSIKKTEVHNNKINFPTNNNNHSNNNNNNSSPKNTSEDLTTQNTPSKRNLMEITSQLHKKTKLEAEKSTGKSESLPKIPIPRLSTQKKANLNSSSSSSSSSSSVKGSQMKFQQTFANLHSASLGMNYTVSVAQNSGKSPVKIEAKVEELKNHGETRTEEAQNLIKREDKSSPNSVKPAVQNNTSVLNLPSVQSLHPKKSSLSPRSSNGKLLQQSRQNNTNLSPRPPSLSPNMSPRPNMSPIPNVPSPRPKPSPERSQGSSPSSTQNPPSPFSPNHILEKYNIQNLAQLTASINFNSAVFGMNHNSQLAALQQAMLLKQFELHNRQNWQLSQYEKYLQNRLLSKEN